MARVVVIGGGLGGLAAAARLAKLGHAVTLCEASDRLGGALAPVEHRGFRWDGGPAEQGGDILASANAALHEAALALLNG